MNKTKLTKSDSAIVAIDFGTTQSCYAYVLRKNPKDIYVHTWTESDNSMKTSTSVLLVRQGRNFEFKEFGSKAENMYWENEESVDYELYRRFKMTLHKEQHVSDDMKVYSEKGRAESAKTIISYALSYIKQQVSEQHLPGDVHNNITWVLTVPAIWSGQSRLFMKKAAVQGGLAPDEKSDKLKIGIEPEAAAFLCMEKNGITKIGDDFEATQLWINLNNGNESQNKDGDHFMVLDGGGGTMDIIAFKFKSDGKLAELIEPSGGDWGGCSVDDAFEEWLEKEWGMDYVANIKQKCPIAWNSITRSFMRSKSKCIRKDGMSMSIEIETMEDIQNATGNDIREKLKKGRLVLDSQTVEKLFEPTLRKITNHLDSLMSNPNMNKIKYAFLVGGFGSSKIVCDYLSAHLKGFRRSIECCFPSNECWTAVAKGAILYALNERKVATRIATKSIGRKLRKPCDQSQKYNENHMYIDAKGTHMVKNVFEPFVQKGQSYANGMTTEFITHPINPSDTQVLVEVYQSRTSIPVHIDDRSVTKYCSVRLDVPKDSDRSIKTCLTFGTELKLKFETSSGEVRHTLQY